MRLGLGVALAVVAFGFGAWWFFQPLHSHRNAGQAAASLRVPDLSSGARKGQDLFNANCVTCHGINAAGTDRGPPLVHVIYEPGHHGDAAFQMAVQNGVPAHHWRFGNMPPVPDLSPPEVTYITTYVRELQQANGIR